MNDNRLIDQKRTKQVIIDTGYWRLLKIHAAKQSMTIKELLEGYIGDGLGKDGGNFDEV